MYCAHNGHSSFLFKYFEEILRIQSKCKLVVNRLGPALLRSHTVQIEALPTELAL